ncbi:MAG: DUF4214 domain-containing protein [Chromatiaceae bacterium]|nr:DUF4214 domain-containing protein [Chromatiaceae bacterium]MCF8002741.1 DUF4214 domain-containing protein [Chromatiaceae bacterium]
MAIQYDQPTIKEDFEQGVLANPSIEPETVAAINQLLNITPETQGEPIDVGGARFDTETGEYVFQAPPEGSVDALIVDTTGAPPGTPIVFPEGFTEVPVVIFNSDEGLTVTFNTIDRVVQMGNGDDNVTVTGDRNTTLEGSDGNDTLTTSAGNDVVRGGIGNDSISSSAGNDSVTGGSGNDTIVYSSGVDTVDGGTGFDYVEMGFAYDSTIVNTTGGLVFSDGAGNSAQIDNVQFVSFSNGHTMTVTDDFDQAAAMRLYQTILGRAADQPGAEFYMDEAVTVENPADFIAAGMLGSDEFTAKFGAIDSLSNAQFVELMYSQGLGRAPDQAGFDFYMSELEAGETRNQVAAEINASQESVQVNSDTVLLLDDTDWV